VTIADSTDRRIVVGAAWMIGARVADRTIGFISVGILARVLVPADFGLIAMATAVVALVETLGAFSFDWALVRDPNLDRSKLDTAWTLRMLVGVGLATIIALAGQVAIHFYDEPRLGPVSLMLAGVYLMSTTENIGTMYFRRELAFDKEFMLRLCGKIAGFMTTVPAAFALRSHWALLLGILAQKGTIVVLSYFMHPYRPRFDLSRSRSLLGFSMWLQLNSVLDLARSRLPDFILGRLAGAQAVGLYSVANETAHLPSTELIAPINRAVFPGYARQVLDKGPLAETFLNVVGLVWVIALPAALGIAAVAPLLIAVLLGQKWLDVIPILQVLSLSAVGFVLSTNVTYIFLAVGKPKLTTVVNFTTAVLFVPGLIYLAHRYGAIGAAYAYGLTALTMLPINYGIVCALLKLRVWRIAAVTWRPLGAALAMSWAVRSMPDPSLSGNSLALAPALLTQVAVGVVVYVIALASLWLLAGRPAGAESAILAFLKRKRAA
jgi:lipopolysaccharide exporter